MSAGGADQSVDPGSVSAPVAPGEITRQPAVPAPEIGEKTFEIRLRNVSARQRRAIRPSSPLELHHRLQLL